MVASETICGMHENQSVKRSEQAWGAARAKGLDYKYQTPVRSIIVEPPEGSVEAKVPKIILQII
ncbi:hypothetical protein DXX76_027850 [Escherichia coli]|nr:hypothetical protein DXX76_027850 [Escherichia coli]